VKRSTYLVPAFEITIQYNLSIDETPSTKESVLALAEKQLVVPMHNYFRPAYMPTDYDRWSRVDNPFHVPYQLYFEPVHFQFRSPSSVIPFVVLHHQDYK
jgi:hypothetical protein